MDKFQKVTTILWQAIFTIMVAELVMSTDHILAVAGAEKGSLFLLIFDLGLSSFFVIFTSNILSKVMDKYPFNLRIN